MSEKEMVEVGLLCCLGGAALYLLGYCFDRKANALQSIPRISQLKKLVELLDKGKSSSMVVAISGRVCSETPMECESKDLEGLRCVIVVTKVVQKFVERTEKGYWFQRSALMSYTSKHAPWYLDDGNFRVNVRGAQGASGFTFPASSSVFEAAKRCCDCPSKDDPQALKILGVVRTELVLPVGTHLNVIGEVCHIPIQAVKDSTGNVEIQAPSKGPFYVSHNTTVDCLVEAERTDARIMKYFSFGLIVIGVAFIGIEVATYIKRKLRRRQVLRRRYRREKEESQKRNVAAATKKSGEDNGGGEVDYPPVRFGFRSF